jgi:hypothetical protein
LFGGSNARLAGLAGSALALLLVKPSSSDGPLRVSLAPTTITDIPATLADLLGLPAAFPGISALKQKDDDRRVRTFASYTWNHRDWTQDYFPYLDIFAIDGQVVDGAAWTVAESIYAPGTDAAGRSRGLFRPERSSQGYVFRWTGPRAFLHAPDDARGIELSIRSVAPKPQVVTVQIDGREVDRMTLADQAWVPLTYRFEARSTSPLWVELVVDAPWRPRGDGRTLGVMTRDLRWTQ